VLGLFCNVRKVSHGLANHFSFRISKVPVQQRLILVFEVNPNFATTTGFPFLFLSWLEEFKGLASKAQSYPKAWHFVRVL
jgi:hypothetical protein